MNHRINEAVAQLKKAKSDGLTYHDAANRLMKQGFSQDEVAHAAYQFPYSADAAESAPSSSSSIDHAFAKGIVHQEAIDTKKRESIKSLILGLLAPSVIGRYFSTKAVSEFAALRDLREQDALGEPKRPKTEIGRVSQRNRAIRYFAILGLASLVFCAPALFIGAGLFAETVLSIFRSPEQVSPVGASLSLWPVAVSAASIAFVALLFFAKKEASIVIGSYCLLVLEFSVFIIIAFMSKSPLPLMIGVLAILPNYWISRRVGILSHLGYDEPK